MTDLCPRCEIDVEDWEHVWSCNDNEKSEYDVLIKTLIVLEKKFKDSGDEKRYKIVKTLAKEIVIFMTTPFNVLILGGHGTSISRRNLGKLLFNIRTDIWLEKCSKISEIEKGKGVTMVDKKRKREDQSDVTTEISLEDGSEEKTNTLKKVQISI
ncbi:hypothetical protein RhiirC2_777561 [Rhizophagus irregularis]|uniref:Uncharacterized protein n=1 Tax=Rhizophagus irregularis TaxID=588596 RepID=A0A2N1NDX2_9GLOM|nr:hypothetical protein RhiirC2_777561 [Rhizophagus irregularis]